MRGGGGCGRREEKVGDKRGSEGNDVRSDRDKPGIRREPKTRKVRSASETRYECRV